MDKKTIIAAVVVVAIIILGSFFFFKKSPPPQSSPQPTISAPKTTEQPAPAPSARTITVPLSSQNNSGESGTATLTDVNGKTNVVIAVSGAPSGVTQPAHIHTGTCAAIGAVTYPLTFPVNGKSETTLNVSLDTLLGQLPLAINIHKSVAESSVYVACGDIKNPAVTASPQNATPSQPAAPTPTNINNNRSGGEFSTPTDRRRGADKPEN